MNVIPVAPHVARQVLSDNAEQRITALEAENAKLRGLLRAHRVGEALRLSLSQAHTLLALYDAAAPLRPDRLLRLIPALWRGERSNVISVNVCHLRAKLGADAIETHPTGYLLSARARAVVTESVT